MKEIILRILRTARATASEESRDYWQEFEVQVTDDAYVLDALETAWRQDPTLIFRHSCHHASCGSCGMRIQGREKLACITPAWEAARGGIIHLEPMRNFPVVADLVVDTGRLARRMEAVQARTVQASASEMRFVNCIECGLCISACPISAISTSYLGPAVLAAAQPNLHQDGVRAQANSTDGVWRCHGALECTDVCPANVNPALAIFQMRKELVLSTFTRRGEPNARNPL